MTEVPAAAIEAAASALHDCECRTPACGPAEKDFKRAVLILEAAAPHIAAAERGRIRQLEALATEIIGYFRFRQDPQPPLKPVPAHVVRRWLDLIGDQP